MKAAVHTTVCRQTSHLFNKQLQLFLETDAQVRRYKHVASRRDEAFLYIGTESLISESLKS
jgi:hypothetical protein